MDPRTQWVAGADPVDRTAEAVARSLLAAALWAVVVFVVFAVAGASVEWFAGLGLLAPLAWLLDWVYPDEEP